MPRLTLQHKAFFALTALLAVMLVIFVCFSRLGLQRGLGPYVAEIELARMDWLAARLQKVHGQHGGWETLRSQPNLWRELRRPEMPARPQFGPTPQPTPMPPFKTPLLPGGPSDGMGSASSNSSPFPGWPPPYGMEAPGSADANGSMTGSTEDAGPFPPPPDGLSLRIGLIDERGTLVAGVAPQTGHARIVLRNAEGRAIGQLVLSPPAGLEREADKAFLSQQLDFVVWTGMVGLAFALLLSWWLARRWLAPIGALVTGARSIAAGRLDTRVAVDGDDELARLVHTFNDMAEQLASMESSRRQWIGDVAHELRTPLAAMRAEIEAVQDGVRTFDPQTAQRLHRQVMRLTQLVGDLRASLDADQGSTPAALVPVQPLALLAEAIASMRPRFAQSQVALNANALAALDTAPPLVRGDAQQLHRVFLNLLENSLRYTDAGGELQVSAAIERDAGRPVLALRFDDSAPCVAEHELPRIFERLYRAEASRTRILGDLGGSGLGLAICRSIVQAHAGQIRAEGSSRGGLRITLTLPLLEKLS
ncbi:MAG: HAMP domain-containing protein [Comamonadaceae bacterium]|nr:MAG: HAMP domain-containing protein [Comamonadaceae bacterium]